MSWINIFQVKLDSQTFLKNFIFSDHILVNNNKSDLYYNPARRKYLGPKQENTSSNSSYTYFNPTRRKRATHRKLVKTVETLVVVDKHVYWKHGHNNITTYVLSMFNIVSIQPQDIHFIHFLCTCMYSLCITLFKYKDAINMQVTLWVYKSNAYVLSTFNIMSIHRQYMCTESLSMFNIVSIQI